VALVVGVALYAAFAGRSGTIAVAPLTAQMAETGGASQTERVAGLETQISPEQRSGALAQRQEAKSQLPMLPSITELQAKPAPLQATPVAEITTTTTPTTRIQTLNRALQTTPTPTAVPRQLTCERSESGAYCIYTVREGDTLSTIAEDFQLRSNDVLAWELLAASNKPDIVSVEDFLQPGQKLRIPTRQGVVHTVILDETLGDLAEIFDVSSEEIMTVNSITDGNLIAPGQVLLIPNPKRLSRPVVAPPAEPDAPAAPGQPPAPPTPEPYRGFIWPVATTIRITNYFSARHPLGIDMGLSHAAGTPVMAVAPGKVTFAGGDACCSYGYYVIVDHGNGLKTLYAHLRSISVSVGQNVSQGQTLGPSGTTGYSTGVHLHFEVHKNGTRVNPMTYLP
jgi:murein DD-endopeptidase MepM/ murein hydrolase activator NlpD